MLLLLCLCLVISGLSYAQPQELPLIGSLGGPGFLTFHGDYAYVGHGQRLVVYDVSDPEAPSPLGSVAMPDGTAFVLTVSGAFVYVAHGPGGLKIVDISEPSAPREVGSQSTPTEAIGVALDGGYAYVSDWGTGLHVFDVRDPANPQPVGFVGDTTTAFDVKVRSGYAYVTTAEEGVLIYDVSVPSAPELAATYDPGGPITEIAFQGNLGYAVTTLGVLYVGDFTDPTDPAHLNGVPVSGGEAWGVTVDGGYAYVGIGGRGNTGFDVFNLTIPDSPALLSHGDAPGVVYRMALRGEYLFAPVAGFGLRVYDVSNKSDPLEVAGVISPATGDIKVSGGYAFVTSWPKGIYAVDVTYPSAPWAVSEFVIPALSEINRIDIQGNLLYVAEQDAGLLVVDITDPTAMFVAGTHDTPGGAEDVRVSGSHAYVADAESGLRIVDIREPSSLTEVGYVDTPGSSRGVDVAEGYAYVADEAGGLRVIDVTDPAAPTEVASLPTPSIATAVMQSNGRVYVSTNTDLRIVDVSVPGAPFEVGSVAFPDYPMDTFVANGYAYVAARTAGLRVIDVRDPGATQEVGYYISPTARTTISQGVHAVHVTNLAYLGAVYTGLLTVAVPPPAPEVNALPPFIHAYAAKSFTSGTVTVSGTTVPGSFVTVGGGLYPVYQQLAPGQAGFSIAVPLKAEAANELAVATVNEYGLHSSLFEATVVEGAAFPATVEAVSALAITPDPAPSVPLNGSQAFTCGAAFTDASTADVTQFVAWSVTNGELITSAGLYVNTQTGPASVSGSVAGVTSNVVAVTDAKSGKALEGVVAGRAWNAYSGLGLGPPDTLVRAFEPYTPLLRAEHATQDASGNYVFLIDEGNYDLQGSSPGYRPETYRVQPVAADAPLVQDFALGPEDHDPPLVTWIEPVDGQVVSVPEVGLTVIVEDAYSELAEASLIVNGTEFSIIETISPEGFYRNVWPLAVGANSIRVGATDTEGNQTVSEELTVTVDWDALELSSAAAASPTDVAVTFNKPATGDDALNPGFYTITDPFALELPVTGVTRHGEAAVALTTAPQVSNEAYTLSAHGIVDEDGYQVRVLATVLFSGYDTTVDSDGDGLADVVETETGVYNGPTDTGTHPALVDTDTDTMPDGWEVANGLDPCVDDAAGDADGDTLTNGSEYAQRCDPQEGDTDGDGLNDGGELSYGTDPHLGDSDGDGMLDGWEVDHGLSPTDDGSTDVANGPYGDPDGDGLLNHFEAALGTDPNASDSDDDDLSDSVEHNTLGTNPLDEDTDGDTLEDGYEVEHGSDPLRDSRVRLAVAFPTGAMEVRGNAVTVQAEVLDDGSPWNVASALFEANGPGTGGGWASLGTVMAPPFVVHWDADDMGAGAYQLRATATTTLGLVDAPPAETTVTVSPSADFAESDVAGTHTQVAPVVVGADNEVVCADTDPATGARVTVQIPAGALTVDTNLIIEFLDGATFDPTLAPREASTDVYFGLTLESGQTEFAGANTATLEVGYRDDGSGMIQGTSVSESDVVLKNLDQGANQFEPILTSSVDTQADAVTGTTDHFSVFALVGDVPPAPLVIATPSELPLAWPGEAYDAPLTAAGGEPPYLWEMTVGDLPPGLAVLGEAIAGTAGGGGDYGFGVRVSDTQAPADTDARAVSIHVVTEGDDSDGDTIPDLTEGHDDVDGDTVPNYLDLDSDGDGASDFWEWTAGYDPYDANDTPPLPLSPWPFLLMALGALGAWRVRRHVRQGIPSQVP